MIPEINQREYQTVILGALLHDVGKFWEIPSLKKRLKKILNVGIELLLSGEMV